MNKIWILHTNSGFFELKDTYATWSNFWVFGDVFEAKKFRFQKFGLGRFSNFSPNF